MKKRLLSTLLLCCLTFSAAHAAKATAKSTSSGVPLKAQSETSQPVELIANMQPGFALGGSVDVKMFDMINQNFGESTNWYFYPVYRAVLANVFDKVKFGLYLDIEKPGYANVTYPIVKVNEVYAKFQEGSFYVKLGRQVFGDTQDLLLGCQNDAVSLGLDLGNVDLMFFLAKTLLLSPWGGAIEGLWGFVPTFDLNQAMALKGYLLVGTEAITVTTANGAEDKMNALILLGARYTLDLPLGSGSAFGLDTQLGTQFAMARDALDATINATGVGMKVDGTYNQRGQEVGFTVAGHLAFTSGATADNASFISPNALVGFGPGLFGKIEDGAGPYTFLDAHGGTGKIRNYAGVLAVGASGEVTLGQFQPGVGVWYFSNTDENGEGLGVEFDEWMTYRLSKVVSFYQQFAVFAPNSSGITPSLNAAMKFVVGSSISF